MCILYKYVVQCFIFLKLASSESLIQMQVQEVHYFFLINVLTMK